MSMSGVFALMSILSSTIPIVYIQNTRTVIDYSGKIIHTKKQGGRVGRCSAKPDTRRKPPEGAAPTADQMRSHFRSRSNGHSPQLGTADVASAVKSELVEFTRVCSCINTKWVHFPGGFTPRRSGSHTRAESHVGTFTRTFDPTRGLARGRVIPSMRECMFKLGSPG